MSMYFTKVLLLLFLLIFSVTALAADTAASAAQSTAWTFNDYLRMALSGAAGGLISSIIAIYVSWRSNKNALKINREKIRADQIAQDKNYENQIKKLQYEEKRKACCDFLTAIDPGGLINCSVDINEVLKRRNLLTIICDGEYNIYVKKISDMLLVNKPILFSASRPSEVNTVEHEAMLLCIGNYIKFFNVFCLVTKNMLGGIGILPSGEWDIMDYESSIPLDYRNRFP